MKRSTASFCVASLRILMSFWASTLVDEVCQIASKDKAIVKANLTPLVFFTASWLCDLCVLRVSASLFRTFSHHVHHTRVSCITQALRYYRHPKKHKSHRLSSMTSCRKLWCSGRDLNPQEIAPTSPSSWRVCQFRHPSLINSNWRAHGESNPAFKDENLMS